MILSVFRNFRLVRGMRMSFFLPWRGAEKPALVVELKWDQGADGAIK